MTVNLYVKVETFNNFDGTYTIEVTPANYEINNFGLGGDIVISIGPSDPINSIFPTPQDAINYLAPIMGAQMASTINALPNSPGYVYAGILPFESNLNDAFNSKVDIVSGKGLSTNDYDATAKGKVDALGSASTHAASDFATPSSVAAAVAALVNSAPSTFDTLGEIATALAADESVAAALATTVGNKVDKSGSKVLSDNNYTTTEQTKLAGIDTGATINSSLYYKGTLKTNVQDLTVVGTVGASGSVTFDLTKTNAGAGGVAAFSEVYPETSNLTNVNGIPFQPSAWSVAGDLKSITMTLKQPGTVGILGGPLSYVNVGSGTTVNLTIKGKAA